MGLHIVQDLLLRKVVRLVAQLAAHLVAVGSMGRRASMACGTLGMACISTCTVPCMRKRVCAHTLPRRQRSQAACSSRQPPLKHPRKRYTAGPGPRTSILPCSSMIDLISAGPSDATARFMRSFKPSASQGPYLGSRNQGVALSLDARGEAHGPLREAICSSNLSMLQRPLPC